MTQIFKLNIKCENCGKEERNWVSTSEIEVGDSYFPCDMCDGDGETEIKAIKERGIYKKEEMSDFPQDFEDLYDERKRVKLADIIIGKRKD